MEKFDFKELLYLNKMILPSIITVIYWVFSVLLALSCLVGGLGAIFRGQIILGLLTIVLGAPLMVLGVRLYCELLVVIFKINENIKKIVDKN